MKNMSENKYIKIKARFSNRIFPHPRTGVFTPGDWIIGLYTILEVMEGSCPSSLGETKFFKGVVYECQEGEEYTITCKAVDDPQYGLQYEILFIGQPADLTSIQDQRTFLGRILTDHQLNGLYSTLSDPMKVIQEEDVETLCTVKDIGVYTAEKIISKVKNAADYSKAYVELDAYKLSNKMIEKLIKKFGSPEIAIAKVKENPYLLADEVEGIGFRKADEIALSNGGDVNDNCRLLYLAKHVLNAQAEKGYSYLHGQDFMYEVNQIASDFSSKLFGNVIKNNQDIFKTFTFRSDRHIGLQSMFKLEEDVAKHLIRIRDANSNFVYDGWEERIDALEDRQGWKHTEEQMDAIKSLFTNQVVVITGIGGTGKTSAVSAVMEILSDYSFAQTALSGRAASRMEEITGEEGFTIHRLLGYNPAEGWFHDENNPLGQDIIVVDEVSMIGGRMFHKLVRAVKSGAKLILLGDTGQLESIGTMNVLHDLIASESIKSCQLTKPHRQALKSGGLLSSMKIREGEQLFDKDYEGMFIMGELQDCIFEITHDANDIPQLVEKYFREELKSGIDVQQLQVLTPKNKGNDLSCMTLNEQLQEVYNPMSEHQQFIELTADKFEYEVRPDDKVINRKNNYKTVDINAKKVPIFNGEIGMVTKLDGDRKRTTIDFLSKGEVLVSGLALMGVRLGYCITTHSFQGSQSDTVIYAIDSSAYSLLNREQLYTAISRMKKKCIIIAENKAFRKAVDTSEISYKQTFLPGLLAKMDKAIAEKKEA